MSPASTPDPRPQRKSLPHDIPPWVGSNAVFFITVCCAERETHQLCLSKAATTIFESIEFRVTRGDWWVHLFVLMPDHLHALISFPQDREIRKVISNWKEIVAKKIGVRWQRDFFDHRLRSNEGYEEKTHYIRLNPVRKGLVPSPADWRFVWEPRSAV